MAKEQIEMGKIELAFRQKLIDFMKITDQKGTFIAKEIRCAPPTIYGWLDGTKSIKLNTCDAIMLHIEKHTK